MDIWAHFRAHVAPDGFKAQICAVDRLACVAYKVALDRVIAKSLVKTEKLSEDEARAKATAMSVCVYSPGQHDGEQHPELVTYQIPPEDVTPKIVPKFLDPKDPLKFIIVCNKLLTGFDAPIEQAMYLDNPLTDHNLLQAIARTNRRYGAHKDHGLIVDYIGISKKLSEALAAYRKEDVQSAMRDEDVLHDKLRAAHKEVMGMIVEVPRTRDVKKDVQAVIAHLGTEDQWFIFAAAADAFLKAYGTLSPDPRVLPYQSDLKFVGAVLPYGRLEFEKVEETDWKKYSEKIRAMLDEHLEVTGLKTVCKLRSLTDPAFWGDFGQPEDIKTAAVRKLAELKKETSERASKNGARYDKFSDRIKALIKQFSAGLIDAKKVLDETETLAKEVLAEDGAHAGSGLNERAYSIAAILEKFKVVAPGVASVGDAPAGGGTGKPLSPLQLAAADIDTLYTSDESAPTYWQDKTELKKVLRGQVRRIIQSLGLDGWQKQIPLEVEHYAVLHYSKP